MASSDAARPSEGPDDEPLLRERPMSERYCVMPVSDEGAFRFAEDGGRVLDGGRGRLEPGPARLGDEADGGRAPVHLADARLLRGFRRPRQRQPVLELHPGDHVLREPDGAVDPAGGRDDPPRDVRAGHQHADRGAGPARRAVLVRSRSTRRSAPRPSGRCATRTTRCPSRCACWPSPAWRGSCSRARSRASSGSRSAG